VKYRAVVESGSGTEMRPPFDAPRRDVEEQAIPGMHTVGDAEPPGTTAGSFESGSGEPHDDSFWFGRSCIASINTNALHG
jgi:hypothetical protein